MSRMRFGIPHASESARVEPDPLESHGEAREWGRLRICETKGCLTRFTVLEECPQCYQPTSEKRREVAP